MQGMVWCSVQQKKIETEALSSDIIILTIESVFELKIRWTSSVGKKQGQLRL